MKKCWLLCVLLMFCALFAACGDEDFPSDVADSQVDSEEEPSEGLRVLLDLGPATPFGELSLESERQEIWQAFREEIARKGGPKDLVFDFIFHDYTWEETGENSSLRDADLTRVRTEIMAGKGPDVFLVAVELFRKQTSVKTCASQVDKGQGMEWDEWYLSEKNWNELSRVREHITSARFRCELDRRLARLFSQCSLFAADRSRMEDEVHKAYSEMQMLLGES